MNEKLLEELLNEDESSSLDFKREQYPFVGATKDQKGEIIKDIIAFANAWRRTDAYILIGVEEVCGGRSYVNGITEHLNEAHLQQLVNSKTNRPIEFSYQAFPFEGKQIGVIHIPVQERPFYLKSDYGRLSKRIVFIRRGSSTDTADIDEITRIGAANVTKTQIPTLELQFIDLHSWELIGHQITLESLVLRLPERSEIPLARKSENTWMSPSLSLVNENYYREYAQFFFVRYMAKPLKFVLHNTGSTLLINARLQLVLPQQDGLRVYFKSELPDKPVYDMLHRVSFGFQGSVNKIINSNLIKEREKSVKVWLAFGNIQPKASQESELLYIGAESGQTIDLEGVIYADNLPNPVRIPLVITLISREKLIDVKQLQKMIEEYEEAIFQTDE